MQSTLLTITEPSVGFYDASYAPRLSYTWASGNQIPRPILGARVWLANEPMHLSLIVHLEKRPFRGKNRDRRAARLNDYGRESDRITTELPGLSKYKVQRGPLPM